MKKSIYLSLVFIGLLLSATGCGNKQAKSSTDDKAYRDSIAAAKAAEEAAQRVADSLSFNVWGDVKFGMTIEEVSKTGAFGSLKGSEEWYEIDGKIVNKKLGTKAIRKVTLGFNNPAKKLERIIIYSLDNMAESRIPDMEADVHIIASIIETGWQTKFKYENEGVTRDKLKAGESIFLLSVDYGCGSLVSNIIEAYEGNKFSYDLVVNYTGSFE